MVYAVSQPAGIAGRLIWGRLADVTRSPNTVMLIISVLMGATAVATGLFTPGWPTLAVCVVAAAFGATAIGWNGVFLGEVARLAPAGSVAATTGGVLTFTYIGVVVGPVLFGYVGDGLGSLGAAFVALAAVPAVAVALLLRVRGNA